MNNNNDLLKNKPKVSIIIPAYNAHKYLKESIDSALSQTYKNIEIIVVNDGSCDHGKTKKIAKSYGNKIKYFEKENGGVSTALNLAISKMTGEYFSWLSYDDRYYSNKIESQIAYLSQIKNNEDIILYSDYDLMNKNSIVYAKSIKNHNELTKKPEYALLRGSINGITLLIPKKAFSVCGLFNENLRCTQDYELWERMQVKYNFVHQPKILATTRLHEKQQSNINPNMLSEGESFWINLIKNTPLETMKRLEETEYNFYFQMSNFLKTTPYKETLDFVNNKMIQIKNIYKAQIKSIKISIIIPFYNRSKQIINAINSVLNQTHQNFEIILVNDGSTDNLSEVLKIVSSNDKIQLINLDKNLGPANARNVGIQNATGDYIAFLDSDDLFKNEKLEKQLLEMVLKNSLISHTSYVRNGFNSEIIVNTGELTGIVIPRIICSCGIATPTLMIHKKLFILPNFKYKTNLKIGEDVCLYLSILKNTSILGIQEPLTIVNVGKDTCAYNYEKQQEGLRNIIQFIINDPELFKYDVEFCNLLKEYINIVNNKNIESTNYCFFQRRKFSIKRIFYLIKKSIFLYRNDRPKLKDAIFYKLRNHPKLLKLLKFFVHLLKKLLRKKHN